MATSAEFDNLSPRQQLALEALLAAPNIKQAAAAINSNEKTLRRYLKEPTFIACLRKAGREAIEHTGLLIQRYGPHALNTLVKVMNDPAASAQAKVNAAAEILRLGREHLVTSDLMTRVDMVEQMLTQIINHRGMSPNELKNLYIDLDEAAAKHGGNV